MKPYNKDAKCSKCGGDDITALHKNKSIVGLWVGEVPDYAKEPERIVRTCKNCGFWWTEAPLDSRTPGEAIKEAINESAPLNRNVDIKTTRPVTEPGEAILLGPRNLDGGYKSARQAFFRCLPSLALATGIPLNVLRKSFGADKVDPDPTTTILDTEEAAQEHSKRIEPATPVIEVGDVVRRRKNKVADGWEYRVVWLRSGIAQIQFKGDIHNEVNLKELTLIRKGAKVHTFENVEVWRYDGRGVLADKNLVIAHALWELCNNKKKYTVTLTEEPKS